MSSPKIFWPTSRWTKWQIAFRRNWNHLRSRTFGIDLVDDETAMLIRVSGMANVRSCVGAVS